MSARRASVCPADHVPVLHNCGPTSHSVYRTGGVGASSVIAPREVVRGLLALAGVDEVPGAMYRPVTGLRLHPALVAAAAGVTLDLAARALCETSPVDDRELHAHIVAGRRALYSTRARYPELAIERLAQLRGFTARICGGTRFNGVVRWQEFPLPLTAFRISTASDLQAAANAALVDMSLLAYAAPPIVSFRRAPSLTFFRVEGRLDVRNFSAPEAP